MNKKKSKLPGIGSSTGISSSSSDPVPMPVDGKTVVKIMRVNGKTQLVEEIASGRYNEESKAWEFTSDEQATKAWLESTFNNPPKRPGSSKSYVSNDESFLFYIMSILLPRKGWLMEWRVGDFVDEKVGKRYDPFSNDGLFPWISQAGAGKTPGVGRDND